MICKECAEKRIRALEKEVDDLRNAAENWYKLYLEYKGKYDDLEKKAR